MKKITLLIIACISIIGMVNAQKPELNGIWKLTETIQYGDLTKTYISYITFKDNGVIETELGDGLTWLKNESENTLTINGSLFKGIEGENKIETLNDKELKLKNAKGETISLQRVGRPKGKELTNKFTGEWLLEKEEKDGKTEFVGALIDLNSNGIFYTQGYMFGEWDYNNITKAIFFDTKKLNGEYSILESNKTSFIIDVEGAKMYFSKIDREKIAKENGVSGLIGIWKHINKEDSDKFQILTFKAPNELSYVVRDGYRQKGGGMWIFNKNEKTVILLGGSQSLEGLNKIVSISSDEISLENKGVIYHLTKHIVEIEEIEETVKTDETDYSTLFDFYEEDFYTENGNYIYAADKDKLPWNNWREMKKDLLSVKQLVYSYETKNEDSEVIENEPLTSNVTANLDDEGFVIEDIFLGTNLSPGNGEPRPNTDFISPLYPLEDRAFRIAGNEQITTPAGTFDCTVIEVGGHFNKKLWMINDKISVYAKIIATEAYSDSYHIYELQEIK